MSERSSRTSAYYSAPVVSFVADTATSILGSLTAANAYDLEVSQREAWVEEIAVLQAALHAIPGTLFLEFDVPRLGSRIDAVLVSGSAIFTIEFKCGESRFHTADYNQVWDYALDLKNFHAASHDSWARPRDSFERADLLGSGGAYPGRFIARSPRHYDEKALTAHNDVRNRLNVASRRSSARGLGRAMDMARKQHPWRTNRSLVSDLHDTPKPPRRGRRRPEERSPHCANGEVARRPGGKVAYWGGRRPNLSR